MKSQVVKRSIEVGGHKTSVSLEEAFWSGVKQISGERGKTLSELVSEINSSRQQGNCLRRSVCSCSITSRRVSRRWNRRRARQS